MIYEISKGVMLWSSTGELFAGGLWAGYPPHTNDPRKTHLKHLGPLPVGLYQLGRAFHHEKLGPVAIPLQQISGETFGRAGFYIHGASSSRPEGSSNGCIIMGRYHRDLLDGFTDKLLDVRP